MHHDLTIEGHNFRLRPIVDTDAAFVVRLRSENALNRYLHTVSTKIEDQLNWLQHYYKREGDYYFVVERRDNGVAEGLISIYDIDFDKGCGEWGRWIMQPSSVAAIESVWLIYRISFEFIRLATVYCRTVANNKKVVSFHDSCGIKARHLLPNHFELEPGGQKLDAIEHNVDLSAWLEIEPRLEKMARLIAQRDAHV